MNDEPRSKLGPIPPEDFDGEPTWRDDEDLDVSSPGWKEKDAALVARLRKAREGL